jgi:hypothetical protein
MADDGWDEEVDQKREERKREPIIESPQPDVAVTGTMYGDVASESSDISQSCEEGREDNNSSVRRIDKILEQLKSDKYPPLEVWVRRRENTGRTSIDYVKELLMLVTELKGHIKEDRQTMRSSIGHFNYIHSSEKRRERTRRTQ